MTQTASLFGPETVKSQKAGKNTTVSCRNTKQLKTKIRPAVMQKLYCLCAKWGGRVRVPKEPTFQRGTLFIRHRARATNKPSSP